MNWRFDLKGWHFHISLNRTAKMQGVNSRLPGGLHFLMWDFDKVSAQDATTSLLSMQSRFKLPLIYLLNTGLPDHYHAYCFKSLTWGRVLYVLAETEYLDPIFFKIGCVRGFFTLRYSPKKGREFRPAVVLPSKYPEDVDPYELHEFVEYLTKRR